MIVVSVSNVGWTWMSSSIYVKVSINFQVPSHSYPMTSISKISCMMWFNPAMAHVTKRIILVTFALSQFILVQHARLNHDDVLFPNNEVHLGRFSPNVQIRKWVKTMVAVKWGWLLMSLAQFHGRKSLLWMNQPLQTILSFSLWFCFCWMNIPILILLYYSSTELFPSTFRIL